MIKTNKNINVYEITEELKNIILNNCKVAEKIYVREFVSYYFVVSRYEPNEILFEVRDKPKELGFSSKIYNYLKDKNINLNYDELRFYLDYLEIEGWVSKKSLELVEWADKEELSFDENKKIVKKGALILKKKKIYIEYKVNVKPFLLNNRFSTIFYAMEFPDSKNENNDKKYQFYKTLKEEIENKLHLKVVMLYDDKQSGNLNTRIKNEIRTCSFFIADLTSKDNFNSNVMYEIGMAKGFNKKILQIMSEEKWIQLEQEFKKIPFDISTHNTIAYSMNETKWESNISEIIRTIQSSLK